MSEVSFSDWLEIKNLAMRYSRAVDTGDFDLLDTVFTDDVVADYTQAGGARLESKMEAKAWIAEALSVFPVRQHLIGNHEITFDMVADPPAATGRVGLFNPMSSHPADGEPGLLLCGGVYEDRYIKTEQGWRIRERVLEIRWFQGAWPEGVERPA